jgi:hypothetical protein
VVLVDFPEFAKRHPRVARAMVGAIVTVRKAVGNPDPHGRPRLWTCADVGRNPRKVSAVAREVYSDLLGLEDSERRINGASWEPTTPVKVRFPGGFQDVEPFVAEACRDGDQEARPFGIVWHRFVEELGLES